MKEQLSIIIPFFNEEGCAESVLREVRALYPDAEIVAVDDGSTDRTGHILRSVQGVIVVSLPTNRGQGIALHEGLVRASGRVCAIIDGDGQNDPRDIATAVSLLGASDCAWGYRVRRQDTLSRRLAGRVANRMRSLAIGNDGVRDAGCSVRAFRKEHVRHLVPFEGMHRFMPSFFTAAGLSIVEFPANHRKRITGMSKHTILGRALKGARDVVRVRRILRK